MTSVKVFGSPTSEEVARVLTCLFEKEVEFQFIRFDTYNGQKRFPEYLRLQSFGQPVTFQDGTKTMIDSREICRYLAETYMEKGNKDLIGNGILERAAIEQWIQMEAQRFDPPSSTLVFNLSAALAWGLEQEEEVIRRSKKELARVLDIYDLRLEESRFLAGDKFTLADLFHLPVAQRLVRNSVCRALFKSRKRVYRWWEEISRRPSWQRAVKLQYEPS